MSQPAKLGSAGEDAVLAAVPKELFIGAIGARPRVGALPGRGSRDGRGPLRGRRCTGADARAALAAASEAQAEWASHRRASAARSCAERSI